MGEPLPPVDESHRVMLSALEALRSTRTATDCAMRHAPQTPVDSQGLWSADAVGAAPGGSHDGLRLLALGRRLWVRQQPVRFGGGNPLPLDEDGADLRPVRPARCAVPAGVEP